MNILSMLGYPMSMQRADSVPGRSQTCPYVADILIKTYGHPYGCPGYKKGEIVLNSQNYSREIFHRPVLAYW